MAEDDVPVEDLKALEVKAGDEDTPGYKAPAKVDLKTIQALDADDESLVKYKQDLLKGAEDQLDEGGPNVLVKKLAICFEDRDNIELDLTGDLSALKKKSIRIKEGTLYKLKISFRVQREIVSGLRFFVSTTRKGVKVDKSSYMVGSYGPKKDEQHFTIANFEEAPKGMIARGHYVSKGKFCDDDKNVHLEWEWSFDITKDW
ncbi:rho GDP-dissociation inhibitor 1-like [Clavelina lepadiformis]|uniref:Rho GDP-dissociation inhibitor 1 n=1 Tax=Clavelina lepadiformis TaxID=159417 RepID=A0ABP0FZZ3_CLALP